MRVGKPQWRIEVQATVYPEVTWAQLRGVTARRYTFVERDEAEDAVKRLRQVQPHAVFRISPM